MNSTLIHYGLIEILILRESIQTNIIGLNRGRIYFTNKGLVINENNLSTTIYYTVLSLQEA
jgi:hypothetical protein